MERQVDFFGKTPTTRTQLRLPLVLVGGEGEWKTRKAEIGKEKDLPKTVEELELLGTQSL